MSKEVRMWLAGAECELRPLAAARYIEAKAEAAALNDALGGDEGTLGMVFSACLIAEGAYADGERVFASGAEVLERLTAQEVLDAGREYALREEGPESGAADRPHVVPGEPERVEIETDRMVGQEIIPGFERPAAETDPMRVERRDVTDGPDTAPVDRRPLETDSGEGTSRRTSDTGSGPDLAARRSAHGEERPLDADVKLYEPGDLKTRVRTRSADETPSHPEKGRGAESAAPAAFLQMRREPGEAMVENGGDRGVERPANAGERRGNLSMQDISDFFERDARRYAGAFTRF